MRTTIFLLLFLIFPLLSIDAQDEAKAAVMVDSFAKVQCEDRSAKLDGFMSEISNNEGHRGLIVVYPSASAPLSAFRTLQDLFAQARFRNFDMNRLDAMVGPRSKEQLIEFWRVPPGGADPELKKADNAHKAAEFVLAKRVWFGDTNSSEESGCVSMPFDLESFALALKNLEGVQGRVAVKGPNANRALKKAKEFLKEMRKHGVEEPAVRASSSKGRKEVTELWIEPIPRSKGH